MALLKGVLIASVVFSSSAETEIPAETEFKNEIKDFAVPSAEFSCDGSAVVISLAPSLRLRQNVSAHDKDMFCYQILSPVSFAQMGVGAKCFLLPKTADNSKTSHDRVLIRLAKGSTIQPGDSLQFAAGGVDFK